MKRNLKFLLIPFMCLLIINNILSVHAATYSNVQYKKSFQRVKQYIKDNGIPLEITFDEYKKEYKRNHENNLGEYEKKYYLTYFTPEYTNIRLLSTGSTNGELKYYYNIGDSIPEEAEYGKKYGKKTLVEIVKKGDILYEASGGFGITGHIALVCGVKNTGEETYIKVIEAMSEGVKIGILDDARFQERQGTILRIKKIEGMETKKERKSKIKGAVKFCMEQLDKKYSIDVNRKHSGDEKTWYCSKLVWAAYYNQSIDIERSKHSDPGITPNDILKCKNVKKIVKYKDVQNEK